jgi:hypothetical protein
MKTCCIGGPVIGSQTLLLTLGEFRSNSQLCGRKTGTWERQTARGTEPQGLCKISVVRHLSVAYIGLQNNGTAHHVKHKAH